MCCKITSFLCILQTFIYKKCGILDISLYICPQKKKYIIMGGQTKLSADSYDIYVSRY